MNNENLKIELSSETGKLNTLISQCNELTKRLEAYNREKVLQQIIVSNLENELSNVEALNG